MPKTVNEGNSRVEIDIKELLLFYLYKWWVIALFLIIGAIAAYAITRQFVTPMYRAKITIYVNNNNTSESKEYVSSADVTASVRLVNTYMRISKSDRVLGEISEKLDGDYSVDELSPAISTEQLNETEIFCIYVLHENPREAARIANAAADVAPRVISELIEGTSAKLIDSAKVPTSKYSPSYTRMAMLGGIVGAAFAVLILSIGYLSDTRINDENDLTNLYSYPVLGRIPNFNISSAGGKHSYYHGKENTSND